MPGPIDASGLIPTNVAATVTEIAVASSAVLGLARRVPMPAGVTQMPVQASVPQAAWLTGVGGRKPFTDLSFGMRTMTAEEVAAIVAIPQAYLDDSAINLWNFVRPQLGQAIATALDNAVVFGLRAPATFPVGGLVAGAITVAAGADAVDTVNDAMGAVEEQGLPVTGHSADLAVKSALRGVRDSNGALLLGPTQIGAASLDSLYGVPIQWGQYPPGNDDVNFITGDWDALTVGVRQDIRYDLDSSGVVADAAGKVLISAFQDDMVLMRVYARYGVVLLEPPTQSQPDGATPFAVTKITKVTAPPDGGTLNVTAAPGADAQTAVASATPARRR